MNGSRLWRYYDVIKFLSLVNGELYFARADKFKDKYEGAIPRQNYLHFAKAYDGMAGQKVYNGNIHIENGAGKAETGADKGTGIVTEIGADIKKEFLEELSKRKKMVAISCWHLDESESAAMWEVYSRAGQGIAVCTTHKKLQNIIKPAGYEMEMLKVDYLDFENDYHQGYVDNQLLPFKIKRKEFQYEHEFRILLYKHKLGVLPEEGVKIPVDTQDIIEDIIASPEMQQYEVFEIQRLLDRINRERGTCFNIRSSRLYENLRY